MVKLPKFGGAWVKYRDRWSAKLGIDSLPHVHPILHINTTTEAQRKKGWSSSRPAPWDLIRTNMDYLGAEIEKSKQLNKQRYSDAEGYKTHFQIIKEPSKKYSLYSFPNQDSYYFYKGGAIAEKSGEDINYAGTTFRSRPDWTHEPRHQHDLFQDKSKTVSVVTAGLEPNDNWICNDYWCGRKPERDARDLGYIVPFKNSVIVPVPLKFKDNTTTHGDLYRTRNQAGKFEETGSLGTGRGVIIGFNGIPIFPEKKVKAGISGIVEQSKKTPRVQSRDKSYIESVYPRVPIGELNSSKSKPTFIVPRWSEKRTGNKWERYRDASALVEGEAPGRIVHVDPDVEETFAQLGINARNQAEENWDDKWREHRGPRVIGYGYIAEAEVGKGEKKKELHAKGETWWEAKARLKPQVEFFEGKSDKYVEDNVKYPTFKIPLVRLNLSRMDSYPESETRERDWEQLGELSSAIRRGDVMTPVHVRKGEKGTDVEGKYVLVDGYHRYLAYKSTGLKDIPAYDESTGKRISDEDIMFDETDLSMKGGLGPLNPLGAKEPKEKVSHSLPADLLSVPTKAELEMPKSNESYKYKLESPLIRTIEKPTKKPEAEIKSGSEEEADEIVKGLEETSTK